MIGRALRLQIGFHVALIGVPRLASAQEVTAHPVTTPSIPSSVHLLHGVEPFVDRDSAMVRAVVEIPAFTRAKWEVDPVGGDLEWEVEDGQLRVIRYALPYPVNYGMIPQTVMAASRGGDGDPLDIVIIGPPLKRGSVTEVRVLGMIQMLDGGEADDKVVAVNPLDARFEAIRTLAELEERFPSLLDILSLWFQNYKLDSGEIEIRGFVERDSALAAVASAHADYARDP